VSRKKLRARDKVTLKNTSDGLVLRNAVTGAETRISGRETNFDLRGEKAERENLSPEKNSGNDVKREHYRQGGADSTPETKSGLAPDKPAALQSTDKQTERSVWPSDGPEPLNAPSKSPPKPRRQAISGDAAAQAEAAPKQTGGKPDFSVYPESRGLRSAPGMNAGARRDKRKQTKPSAPKAKTSAAGADNPEKQKSADKAQNSGAAPAPADKASAGAVLRPDKPGKPQSAAGAAPDAPNQGGKKLAKAQTQADKAAAKLDAANSKLPAKKKIRARRVFDEKTGQVKQKLQFEREVKSQAEHLKGAPALRPVKAAANATLAFGHRKISQVEKENAGTEAAHKGERAAEGLTRSALRFHRAGPYRKAAKLERQSVRKSIDLAYQKTLAANPKLKSNMLSRAFQRRKIRKDYAKAAREAKRAAERAKKTGSLAAEAAKAVARAVKRHPFGAAIAALIALPLLALMPLLGAFGGMGSGTLSGLLAASYLAEDSDIDSAELAYTEWETGLLEQIADAESAGGYDEYRYNIGEIGHDPHELMAYLTAKHQNFLYGAIEADLRALFAEQYSLAFTPATEIRYRTVTKDDPDTGESHEELEAYEWRVLTVTLTARPLAAALLSRMDSGEYVHYALLLETKGSRQYLENPFGDLNWLPYVTSYYGWRIHPISGGKDLHRGLDIGVATGREIQAGQSGTVTFAGYAGNYGNVVVLDDGQGLVSKYAHCDRLFVTAGQSVKAGEVIATAGNTGNSTGAHLHLEILKNGIYLNPIYFCR
jgi:murein DD-endopeptidase MepM/ murein hydrolase activator NlpD